MAYEFNGSTQYLSAAPATLPLTSFPYTMAGWFKPDAVTANQTIVSQADSASARDYHRLLVAGAATNDPLRTQTDTVLTSTDADDENGCTGGAWQHGAGVMDSSLQQAFLDGVSSGSSSGAANFPSGQDNVSIGVLDRSTFTHPFDGRLAEVALWSVALTAAEIGSLAAGMCPLFVRPGSLVFYWPGRAGEGFYDVIGGLDMASNNGGADPTAVDDHPSIIYPASPLYLSAAAAAAARRWSGMRGLNRMGA